MTELLKTNSDPFKRNESGLLDSVSYVYRENGSIDWRAMVKPEYTVINAQYKNQLEQIHQKGLEDIRPEEVEDKYLLVLLAGFKELAQIRGYSSVDYSVHAASPEYVMTACTISWIPNFETRGEPLYFTSLADASFGNTTSFGSLYLAAVAENRAFVRCVRNALGIHIVGADELGPKSVVNPQQVTIKKYSDTEPHGMLQNILKERKKSFEQLKTQWMEKGNHEAEKWSTLDDLTTDEIFLILESLKKPKK